MKWLNSLNMKMESLLEKLLMNNYKVFVVLFIIVFGLYFKSLWYNYTFLDDADLIIKNHEFLSKWENIPKSFIKGVFMEEDDKYYRPILTVSFIIDEKFSGTELWGYHLSNIVYHLIATFLLFYFLITINASRYNAFILAVVFAVHPVFVLAVAWVPGRNDILMAIFLLLSLISFVRYLNLTKVIYLCQTIIFFSLSLFTKESSIMFLPTAVLYFLLFQRTSVKQFTISMFFSSVSLVLFLIIRGKIVGSEMTISLINNYLSVIWYNKLALLQHLGNFFLPIKLSVMHTIHDYPNYLGVISLFFVCVILYFKRTNLRIFIFAFFIYFSFFVPSLVNLISMEHRLYFPAIGLIIILSSITINNKIIKGLLTLIVLILVLLNLAYQSNFQNGAEFYENARKTSPNHPLVYDYSGFYYFFVKEYDESKMYYMKSLGLLKQQEFPFVNKNDMITKAYKGIFQAQIFSENWVELEATVDSLLAKNQQPSYFYFIKALALIQRKEYKKAETFLGKSLYYDKNIEISYYLLIHLYKKSGETKKSEMLLKFANELFTHAYKYEDIANMEIFNKKIKDF